MPPGDFRNNIVALAEVEPLMARLFQHRFSGGATLDGHSFGNLFVLAMADVTGSFEQALRETSRVWAVKGTILPSTLDNEAPGPGLASGNVGYSASKHGVIGLTKSAALAYARSGVRVNAVCPGYLRTPAIEALIAERGPELETALVATEPVRRLGSPEEVADLER